MEKRVKKKSSTYDTVFITIAAFIFIGTVILVWPITLNSNLTGLLFGLVSIGVYAALTELCNKSKEEKGYVLFPYSILLLIFIGVLIVVLTGFGIIPLGGGIIAGSAALIVTLSLGLTLVYVTWPPKNKLVRYIVHAMVAASTLAALGTLILIAQGIL